MNVRVACAQVLASVMRGESSFNSLLPNYLEKVSPQDAGLLQELCYGTMRYYSTLEVILEQLLEKPLKTKDADISALLLSGLYQIREMRIPSHAAVNETVNATKNLKKPWAKGLINGVLRTYLREAEAVDSCCSSDIRYQTAHPRWLVEALYKAWPHQAAAIIAANNQRPPMTLRVNERRISRSDYLALLQEQQIDGRPAPLASHGIYLQKPCDVTSLPGFAAGLVSVQDEAAQLCADFLDLASGQLVLDACCAPGGKSCHILEHQAELAELVALDVDSKRLLRVQENFDRLGVSATLKTADAAAIGSWWNGKPFDRILLDAPCSASGVIRRHPDIKLLRKPGDIVKLAHLQQQLLSALWMTLKPGGKLLYATCSVFPAENDEILAAFSNQQQDCRLLPLTTTGGVKTPWGTQFFPQIDGHDGFYYGLLEKMPG
ncbi:MAG: 16S rRNA (cytosine(967)-C(5))-methyltransferase RsmB [Porticoccaceae bacterium]|nr:16S rRNA (cytosine(967)-C(5))-methyltransferase RsmB [Porticoccaceae bacterium]